jgi:hypothetical protein
MKKYTVDITYMGGSIIDADTPKEALNKFMKQLNFTADITPYDGHTQPKRYAKVCLLGGTRESVSYYVLSNIKARESQYAEVRSNYEDDEYVYIDAWKTDKDNEEGKVVARVHIDTGKVQYLNEKDKYDTRVNEEIKQVLADLSNNRR